MALPDGELTVAQRLGRALDRGLLPAGGPAEAAERLIERLERPARIALLGLPGSGKSSILNLLVGTVVVPETLRLPTIVVQHGDVARMICTLTDGTTKILPGSDLAEVLPLAPALVTLEMDLPALKVISLLEVSAGPMEAEQKRAATWASKRADIVIWCTTSYLPKEQAVWESLPDAVKDNSFMFLTKVDLLGSRDSAQAMHDRVELRAGEEFRQILSISAKQARAAVLPGGQMNRELFRDSGAGAVITAIKTRVQSGRRADTDTAELLLARHVEASELVAKRFAEMEEEEAPKPWTPPPETELEAAEPVEPAAEEPDDAPATQPEAIEVAVEPEPEPLPEPEAQPEPEPAAASEPDPLPEIIAEVQPSQPEPVIETPPAPAVQEPEPGTRRRFADRIKRVASDGDAGPAPKVPLRSTWKSKAETEAAPAPAAEPEPAARPAEATRRPRVSQPAKDAPPVPAAEEAAEPIPVEVTPPTMEVAAEEMPDLVSPEPDLTEPAAPEPEPGTPSPDSPVADVPKPDAPEAVRPAPRDRGPRAVTPRPQPEAEAPRTARPNLFGARRAGMAGSSPLPDLSGLRATQAEMEAALEESADAVDEALEDDLTPEAEPLQADPAALTEPEPEPEAELETPPKRAVERPRLFERAAPAAPAPPPTARPEATPRSTPVSRLPAPPRVLATPAPVATAPTASVADDAQFSPRAIMRREPRTEVDTPAPRRERPRIAARAVPATSTAAAPVQVSGADQDLVEESLRIFVTRSAELETEFDPEAKVPVDLILEHSRETGEQVMAVVSRGQSEALRRINNDLGGVLDTITLMQLEKGHAPADDALTLLLQLKRELETLRAV
jgi:hypothetical protein